MILILEWSEQNVLYSADYPRGTFALATEKPHSSQRDWKRTILSFHPQEREWHCAGCNTVAVLTPAQTLRFEDDPQAFRHEQCHCPPTQEEQR